MENIYLDNSATTRVNEEVAQVMFNVMTKDFGNPSSLHRIGLNAEKILKASRATVAGAFHCSPEEVYFTSCGTESNNTVIRGVWNSRKKQGKRIITTQVEHPAVLEPCKYVEKQGAEVIYLPVDKYGKVDMQALREALNQDTILVSVMYVNNETGAVNDIAAIRREMDKVNRGILLHTDAVQAFEKEDCDVNMLGVDFMSVSGHKIHGPKGIGALYIRKGVNLPAFMLGGGQERGMRSGTEGLPCIAGFAKAVEMAETEKAERLAKLQAARQALLQGIQSRMGEISTINSPQDGAPSILNVSFPGCRGEVLLHSLEENGIYVSTGSACSSNSKKKGSHVLKACGLSDSQIEGALRFSFGAENSSEQMETVLDILQEVVQKHRKMLKLK